MHNLNHAPPQDRHPSKQDLTKLADLVRLDKRDLLTRIGLLSDSKSPLVNRMPQLVYPKAIRSPLGIAPPKLDPSPQHPLPG